MGRMQGVRWWDRMATGRALLVSELPPSEGAVACLLFRVPERGAGPGRVPLGSTRTDCDTGDVLARRRDESVRWNLGDHLLVRCGGRRLRVMPRRMTYPFVSCAPDEKAGGDPGSGLDRQRSAGGSAA